jgi:ComF family protein
VLEWLLDLVFPPKCLVCERRGVALCPGCRHHLPYLPGGVCPRCASHRRARGTCVGCQRLSPALSSVRAPLSYSGPARRAVLALKFRSGRCLAPTMGELLRAAVSNLEVDLVVPVPLSAKRLRLRGFNQATLLAEQVAESVHGALSPDVLSRTDRPAQSTLSATERLSNLTGVFVCSRPDQVQGQRVLLVDDVITTGATVSACADTLAEAGAKRVFALAFARDL